MTTNTTEDEYAPVHGLASTFCGDPDCEFDGQVHQHQITSEEDTTTA